MTLVGMMMKTMTLMMMIMMILMMMAVMIAMIVELVPTKLEGRFMSVIMKALVVFEKGIDLYYPGEQSRKDFLST